MIELSLRDIATLVQGTLCDLPAPSSGDSHQGPMAVITAGVVTDSRQVRPGVLFAALPGEQVDGHDFASEAIAGGAVAVLAQRRLGLPAIVVDEVQQALGLLAAGVLERLPAVVVGVTGSSGKTSTKDLLAQVLTPLGPVVAPPGSFNNELGLPLTVLQAQLDTAVVVLEFGARGVGHIRTLTTIAPPQVAVVLNVGSAHVGEFGSPEVTAQAKSELVQVLPSAAEGGVAVLNADDWRVAQMAQSTSARVVQVGVLDQEQGPDQAAERGLDVWAQQVHLDSTGQASFTLASRISQLREVDSEVLETAQVALQVYGRHQVGNAVAAAAVGLVLGLPLPVLAQQLSQASATSRWRMEVNQRHDGLLVINDTYNANPESMRAALEATHTMAQGQQAHAARPCWAILGPMRELGPSSEVSHQEVGRLVAQLGFQGLITVEPDAQPIAHGARQAGFASQQVICVADYQHALHIATQLLPREAVVVIKASRAAGLERVAAALLSQKGLPDVRDPSERPVTLKSGTDNPGGAGQT